MREYILCAAIWYKDLPTQSFIAKNQDKGLIVLGHRHGYCIDIMKCLGKLRSVKFGVDSVGENIQGFLTNTNRFVDRKDGGIIAFKANQTKELKETLYSEDLY